jgi:exopolyphosphatase/guanosine-5'-triphosphate,3'-diphosphate pyrophosphatase
MPFNAKGRLDVGLPIAIIDIGSNSVRLVVYEGLSRTPTPIFNEKVLCGLGRAILTTGLLPTDGMERAYDALTRFRVLCDVMSVSDLIVFATAAARDAHNGADFIENCQKIIKTDIAILSGKREAELSALGIISGFWKPQGLVGDLGGGSLELIDVKGTEFGKGVTLPLGVLSLLDVSGGNLKKAQKQIKALLDDVPQLKAARGQSFYAVGGTWRSLAKLHMGQRGYPLNVMHNYVIPAQDAADFASLVERVEAETLESIESVSFARRPLLVYGALVLEELIRSAKPARIVISALGVREGILFDRLDKDVKRQDPLLAAASDLNKLRSRAPRHGEELVPWMDGFFESTNIEETTDERRLRHAACLLSDIGWRAHPDYRGEQSVNIIANAGFSGIDHSGRAYLALTAAYRHMGLSDDEISPRLKELASSRLIDRARIFGAAIRVAYLISAAMPTVLPQTALVCRQGKVELRLPAELAALAGDRVFNRLKALGKMIGRSPMISISKS